MFQRMIGLNLILTTQEMMLLYSVNTSDMNATRVEVEVVSQNKLERNSQK